MQLQPCLGPSGTWGDRVVLRFVNVVKVHILRKEKISSSTKISYKYIQFKIAQGGKRDMILMSNFRRLINDHLSMQCNAKSGAVGECLLLRKAGQQAAA